MKSIGGKGNYTGDALGAKAVDKLPKLHRSKLVYFEDSPPKKSNSSCVQTQEPHVSSLKAAPTPDISAKIAKTKRVFAIIWSC
jgi:hypothetical protein